jgi:uncharacterized protein (TIGR00369 family)
MRELTNKEQEMITYIKELLGTPSSRNLHLLGRLLGIEWNDKGEATMKLGDFNGNTYGVAQGGALYTLADIAIGFEILDKLEANKKVVTLEMKMNFIKPGMGDLLVAKTEILHWGRTTVVGTAAILDEEGDLVAQSLGTFHVS